MLREQKETVGLNKGAKAGRLPANGGAREEPPLTDDKPTLADSGIDKKLSSRAVLVPYRGQGQKSVCRIFAVLSRSDRGKFG